MVPFSLPLNFIPSTTVYMGIMGRKIIIKTLKRFSYLLSLKIHKTREQTCKTLTRGGSVQNMQKDLKFLKRPKEKQ